MDSSEEKDNLRLINIK